MHAAVATVAQAKRPTSRQNPWRCLGVVSFCRAPRRAVSSSAAASSECIDESRLLEANRGSVGAMVRMATSESYVKRSR